MSNDSGVVFVCVFVSFEVHHFQISPRASSIFIEKAKNLVWSYFQERFMCVQILRVVCMGKK